MSCSSARASSIRTPSVALLVPARRLGGPADRRGDPRLDGARADRLLRAEAGGRRRTRCSTRRSRASCSSGRRSGAWFRRRSTSSARRGRAGPTSCGRSSSAARFRTPSAWPTPIEGRELLGKAGPGGEAAADGPSRRPGPERPVQRRDRGGRRRAGRLRGARLRRRHRRRRARGPLGGRLRRLRGAAHARRRRGRHRRPGQVELADPQLPRLPEGRQRQPARRAGLRAGVGLRRELPVHAPGDRAQPLGRPAQLSARGRPARQRRER